MRPMFTALLLGLLAAAPPIGAGEAEVTGPHHAMEVSLDPAMGELRVSDILTFPGTIAEVEFLLHARLAISRSEPAATEVPLGDVAPFLGINADPEAIRSTPLKRYRALLPRGVRTLSLAYEGRFDFPLS